MNNVVLKDASDGQYIMLKEEYSESTLTSKGIQKAYDTGVEPELYLEVKYEIDDIKDSYDTTDKRKSEVKNIFEA